MNPSARIVVPKSKLTLSLVFRSQHNQPPCSASILSTMSGRRQCPHCDGIKQHTNKKKYCQAAQRREVSSSKRMAALTNPDGDEVPEPHYRTKLLRYAKTQNHKKQRSRIPATHLPHSTLCVLTTKIATTDQEPMDMDMDHDVPDDTSHDPN